MKKNHLQTAPAEIDALIIEVRGQKAILDADLARIYGTATKFLNRAVKRNPGRFPPDFVFQLSAEEAADLRFHFGTSKSLRGGRRYLPYAFTEHGAIMAANVLNSPRAVDMSVFVVRAFVKMRSALAGTRELARKLALLEQELKIRLNIHEAAIVDVLQRIMRILDPPPPPPEPPTPEIGFHVKEAAMPYRTKRKARS
ncbi:MAG TPA: ORF6N domain-containing protein [Candidatus Paceibacterota bacterium]|nr:ORF6N domain-containing protein [Candidatus Paceibacterota bacterium]